MPYERYIFFLLLPNEWKNSSPDVEYGLNAPTTLLTELSPATFGDINHKKNYWQSYPVCSIKDSNRQILRPRNSVNHGYVIMKLIFISIIISMKSYEREIFWANYVDQIIELVEHWHVWPEVPGSTLLTYFNHLELLLLFFILSRKVSLIYVFHTN